MLSSSEASTMLDLMSRRVSPRASRNGFQRNLPFAFRTMLSQTGQPLNFSLEPMISSSGTFIRGIRFLRCLVFLVHMIQLIYMDSMILVMLVLGDESHPRMPLHHMLPEL